MWAKCEDYQQVFKAESKISFITQAKAVYNYRAVGKNRKCQMYLEDEAENQHFVAFVPPYSGFVWVIYYTL